MVQSKQQAPHFYVATEIEMDAIIAADVVGLTTEMADRIRRRVGAAIDRPAGHVLLSSSHSHAAPWPGATIELGSEFDGWTETDLRNWDSLPDRYASAAVQALDAAVEARVSGGVAGTSSATLETVRGQCNERTY